MAFKYNRRVYGKIRTINNGLVSTEPIGYCHCDLHKGYLLTKDIKKHECREKCCKYFELNTSHQYLQHEISDRDKRHNRKRIGKAINAAYLRDDITLREKQDLFKRMDLGKLSEVDFSSLQLEAVDVY